MRYKMFLTLKITIILYIQKTICDDIVSSCNENIYNLTYKGESFPTKYLFAEDTAPTAVDLDNYIKSLQKTVNYFYKEIRLNNDTEINRVLGMFYMKAILKRINHDHQEKLSKSHYRNIKNMIKSSEEYISRYVFLILHVHKDNQFEFQMTRMIRDDSAQVYSIGKFNKDRLRKWIMSNTPMHSYIEKMDNLALAKEDYTHIVEDMKAFSFNVEDSDRCISKVAYNPEPIDLSELQPCRPDPYCREFMLTLPSAAYALSHRLLIAQLLRHNRRCYIQTEKEHDDFMDKLCAFMYREAVYLARRGYFARDIFLEHVALCGLFGYEEFFRHQWFRKSASWIDDVGCIHESHNFLINRSRIYRQRETNVNKRLRMVKKLKISLLEDCNDHPMALLLVVLAHAIRHTLNFMTE